VAGPEPQRRRPGPAWRSEGTEPDYRFSLANERTFLAWIRTGLALLAAAVAVVLAPSLRGSWTRTGLGVGLTLTALLAGASSYTRWRGNERAMRRGEALPHTPAMFALSIAVCAIGVAVLGLILLNR
jgi:putative membrane protein